MRERVILVIEDQDDLRGTLQATLTGAGYRVVTAANGRAASEAFAHEQLDLVLTDMLMPDKDGIEVIADLRKTRPNLPFIAMSGGGRAPAAFYLQLARRLGAKAILQKPFSPEQLLMTVAFVSPAQAD
jgi:CheY-like chemotaxis protein